MAPPKKYEPDLMERQAIQLWQDKNIFEAQLAAGRAAYEADPTQKFIFLEGPPTANGLPHPGHVLTRTLKDSVNRFHAMQGKWVPRKAGWDCHGLPVEIEVQKELGIEHVDQIEEYGVEPFLAKCKESVFRYKGVWEEMTERVGMWVDFENAYVTMDDGYIDTVWWSLKRLFDQGLLVKAHKVVPYSPVTGTTYSSHEVAQGYRDVMDTSVFVKFHLKDDPDNAKIVSWTTTPWTLPGNVALAVGADIDYVKVRVGTPSGKTDATEGEVLILAEALFKNTMRDHGEVIAKLKGSDLVGMAYEPLFPGAVDVENGPHGEPAKVAWEVVAADFVTTEDGTGVVHTAVMYGEDDYQLGMALGLPAQHTVGLDGKFIAEVPHVAGMYVKDDATEEAIFAYLREKDMLYRTEEYEHSYPHCWRTDTPLLYYAMESWYIRMSLLREKLLANNKQINWVPETIQEGRMGDWLRNVKDWAFSRSRYWGTPLPVWICQDEECGEQTCMGGRDELASHGLEVPELHRPHVDKPIKCPKCGGQSVREPYVIDVWYDSGAAQFAQFHDRNDMHLDDQWPIDFIAEGLDQTRGWFYSLLAIATALGDDEANQQAKLFQGPPYNNVVVNGLILAEDGQKMSKSKKNYVSPDEVFANVGADATRWYLLSATAPWQDKRFFEDAVRDTFGKYFSTLWNTFLFQQQYAELDNWKPEDAIPFSEWSDLDRWLGMRLQQTTTSVMADGNKFHLHKATRAIEEFVVNDLSNWWVRRSRDRFWAENDSTDKASAHSALWTALHYITRLTAPFAPFMVEHIWQHIRRQDEPESIHLAHLPSGNEMPATDTDAELAVQMKRIKALAEAGRALRSKIGIPTRQPLGRAIIVGDELGVFAPILEAELNVKQLDVTKEVSEFRSYVPKPNRATLGPAFKQHAPAVADAIEALDGDHAYAQLQAGKPVGVNVDGTEHGLTAEHIRFEETDKDGWATTQLDHDNLLVLHVQRNEELLSEALTREVIRRIQDVRKQMDMDVMEQIDVTLQCDSTAQARLDNCMHILRSEVRAREITFGDGGDLQWDIDGFTINCGITATGEMNPLGVEAA